MPKLRGKSMMAGAAVIWLMQAREEERKGDGRKAGGGRAVMAAPWQNPRATVAPAAPC